ncbi:ABC-2 family transporter protein [Pseudobythopirellula maris]|uniref:ABC-2 family transporter protein n=1 Tax=Pseudobythopirellula maris TaxID=2527991 RepID=A0A5C5ZMM4_9BACT|nr:ABC transporter permease subunit [Pseudobythopirellula maris]TWT87693.1 ABC-2 family transporter protein [Pseudobythopirellula maris]
MYLTQNPVLQHELLSNLRRPRAFWLLAAYVGLLGAFVLLAWPQSQVLDMAQPEEAKRLVGLFFLGQYLLASLMAPSFAAGAITGEKERDSFEMLIASPLKPGAIVLGKLFAALAHLGVLMVCSLPIVMLCLPLGGVSPYEVGAAYVGMIASVGLFGVISLWASSYFGRTSSSLVVSYLMILPLAMGAVLLWNLLGQNSDLRLLSATVLAPIFCLGVSAVLWRDACRKLLEPGDLGSGGRDAIDLETEASEAVGLYIDRESFPDRLFAPPKRNDFLEEGANPIYDKEMRSEIFSQGTLMLRLVIQISMVLAIPLMAVCLFVAPQWAPWYVAYVLLFNMLVGPVFSAGSVSSERERQTLDLLLVTLITPWQMLWGKLLSGLRVSTVLTGFLMWPVALACLMPVPYWQSPMNILTLLGYFLIVLLACLTTSLTSLVCSALFRKTTTSLITSYALIGVMFLAPAAARFFADTFYSPAAAERVAVLGVASPFSASAALPLVIKRDDGGLVSQGQAIGEPMTFFVHLGWALAYNLVLLGVIVWLFRSRWRVSE